MAHLSSTIRFDSVASRPMRGHALIYDLSGFSKFFNQPDVNEYVPKFLNRISEAISTVIFGGRNYWSPDPHDTAPLTPPIHEKFLGDGALYLWATSPKKQEEVLSPQELCNRLWNLQNEFSEVLNRCKEDVPVVELPAKIRFGLASGTIFELRREGTNQREYIGFCINLASRLQKYCPDLGFIASARIGLTDANLAQHEYVKVIATQIKGFPHEIVIVDKDQFNKLDAKVRDALFEPLK